MSPLGVLILLLALALPIAWLASEFGNRRPVRIALGIALIASAYIVGQDLSQFKYNHRYGWASKSLVDATIVEIEDGNVDRVMKVLRRLKLDYRPTYENRAGYDDLVAEAVTKMKGTDELANTKWDLPALTRNTWEGHWENETGFWLVIEDYRRNLEIVRSGGRMHPMTNVTLSEDFRELRFNEGLVEHKLTLENKYEANHVTQGSADVWQVDTLHKLIRATPEQRKFTQHKRDD